jgi:phosphoribosylglycinamide formyltransferase-1
MVTKWLVEERLTMKDGKAFLDGFELGAHGYATE